jgi:hypothetical protein
LQLACPFLACLPVAVGRRMGVRRRIARQRVECGATPRRRPEAAWQGVFRAIPEPEGAGGGSATGLLPAHNTPTAGKPAVTGRGGDATPAPVLLGQLPTFAAGAPLCSGCYVLGSRESQ